jgi:ribosomal protein S18 acetylase RimI-like enzyme
VSAEGATPLLRPALAEDEQEAVPLLYESGGVVYPRFAGSRGAALSVLAAAYRRSGTTASAEVVTLAEVDGRVVGALVAFPVTEGARRARRYMKVALARLPPWRWRRALRIFRALRPAPPSTALYIDSLATAAGFRRAGVATALLEHAAAQAVARGCTHVTLETEVENSAARALYREAGFRETDVLPPVEPRLGEGYVCLLRELP